jgi:hypothetical protein
MLRNWERNGLLIVPRDPTNYYRLYGSAECGRLWLMGLMKAASVSYPATFHIGFAQESEQRVNEIYQRKMMALR